MDHALDLFVGERVAEGRHVTVESADRTATVDHRVPVAEWLDGVGRAIGEVGQ
jgi:hypothetical protein